jgi:cytochrome oxidase Cu insertion factor (SCO1/SenC/PrrC family)
MKNSTSGLLLFVICISALFSPQILLETASAGEFPEISVVNQDSKPLRMSDFRGRNILLSFVYASCPMPEMCPLTMAINKKIISAWKNDRQPFPFHVVFATLDPEEDGPEEMKTYGTNNKLDFKDFTLITGKNSEMADLSSAFDSAPIPGEKLINHQVVSVLLDPNLKVIKKFFGNKYTYDEIKKLVAASTSQFQGKVTSSDSKINPLALQTNASEESAKFQNQLPKANNTTPSAIDLSERKTLMGIDPKKYDKFWENWRLVNVRYRTSPAEQRFVYANDIAWRTLKSGGAKFEEGAVFAKIAYTVGFDARFPSSYEPNKFSRIQFMKKDSKRYQSTDGWGYALYLQNSEQEEKFGDMELQACHACHKLAANHDYVFDTPVFVSSNKFVASGRDFFENFRSIRLKDAPAVVSNLLKTFDKNVPKDLLDYQITAFQGTISESMLPVARLASERASPVLLRAKDDSGFVLAIKTKQSNLNCSKAAKLWVKDIQLIPGQAASETPREMIFCDGVFK